MKITQSTIFYVELDEDEYTRHSATNWTTVMGESDEPVYDCAWLEKLFQKEMLRQANEYDAVCNNCGETEDIRIHIKNREATCGTCHHIF
jgi:hypothetical protein